jgi:hypothetical protein
MANAAEANETTRQREDGSMHVGAPLVTEEQPTELVEPGESALNDPSVSAKAGAVRSLTAGDHGLDPAQPEQAAVHVEVIPAIGDHALGPPARCRRGRAPSAPHRRAESAG